MLRYTFEQITGNVGSTFSIYNDRCLISALPGEAVLMVH